MIGGQRQMTGLSNSRRRAGHRLVTLFFALLLLLWVPYSVLAAPYAAMVMDARSGEVIFARNHDTRLHPASLTKMMTLYIAFEAVQNGEIGLDTMVTISANAASEPCSCLGLRAGQRLALRHLIRAAAIRSANDASTAIAEAISGSEAAFAERMNRTARAIGMNNTTFRNAHGLTAQGHLSTARDMTILGRQLYFDYPQYYNLFSRRSTDAGVASVLNTNRRFLDAYSGADGIKTGYTRAAGFNLVGSAERGGKRIIATVFGGQSVAHRNAEMARLLDLGFDRAPARVAVRRPARPDYRAPAADTASVVRTVRLETSISRSPIPPMRGRPAGQEPPAEVLVALQAGIDSALAEVAEAIAPATATLPPPRPEAFAAVATAAPSADAAAQNGIDQVSADTVAQAPAVAVLQATADTPAAPARPTELAAATGPEAVVDATAEGETPLRVAGLAATSPSPPDDRSDAVEAELAAGIPPMLRPVDEIPTDIVLTSASATVAPAVTGPAAGSGENATPATEVVRRTVSTSDPRVWGVHVGRYGSRFDAERALIQTALVEISALDGALRRVQPRSGGFEAHFVGLTREQADLACRRLQARDRMCFTLAP